MSRVFELEMQRDILKEKNKKLKAKLTEATKKYEEQAKEIARLKAALEMEGVTQKVAAISTTTSTNPYTERWTTDQPLYNIAGSDSVQWTVNTTQSSA